jgi:restriction system protein
LARFPEFVEFKTMAKHNHGETIGEAQKTIVDSLDPKEMLENAYHKLKDEVADELLREVKSTSPSFFEKLVVELLVKMGYGGSREDAGQAIGQSGDEGIERNHKRR